MPNNPCNKQQSKLPPQNIAAGRPFTLFFDELALRPEEVAALVQMLVQMAEVFQRWLKQLRRRVILTRE